MPPSYSSESRIEIARRLSVIKDRQGALVKDIAQKMGDDSQTISNALNGKKVRSFEYLTRLSEVLGVSKSEFEKICIDVKKDELRAHGVKLGDEDINGYALLSKQTGVPEDDIRMMIEVIKKSKKI